MGELEKGSSYRGGIFAAYPNHGAIDKRESKINKSRSQAGGLDVACTSRGAIVGVAVGAADRRLFAEKCKKPSR